MGKLLSLCLKRPKKSKSNDSPRESRQPSIELNELPRRVRAGTSRDDPVKQEIRSRRATVGAVTERYKSADSGTRIGKINRMSQMADRMFVSAQELGTQRHRTPI